MNLKSKQEFRFPISISNCEFKIEIFDLKNLIIEFDPNSINLKTNIPIFIRIIEFKISNSIDKSKFFDFTRPGRVCAAEVGLPSAASPRPGYCPRFDGRHPSDKADTYKTGGQGIDMT